jgi:hypothetical protein
MTTGASNYTMPTPLTYGPTAEGSFVDGNPTTVTITTTGASVAAAPIAVLCSTARTSKSW